MSDRFLEIMDGINYRIRTGKGINSRERAWYDRYHALIQDVRMPFEDWIELWRDLNAEVIKGASE